MKFDLLQGAAIVLACALSPLSGSMSWAQTSDQDMWVTADRLTRRTCPSTSCGNVGWLLGGQKVTVSEERDGWSRVSKSYDASCNGGVSAYIDQGNSRCEEANGIVGGQLAEWVSSQYLSALEPAEPVVNSESERLVAGSDNFESHREAFVIGARELIENGSCSEADFLEMGGWSASAAQGKNVYFIFCGGMTVANRIYLNVGTGRTYR